MYRGNPERTGNMPGPGIDGQPVELWRVEVGGRVNSAPAVVDGVLYVGAANGGVFALDIATGSQVWQFNANNPISSSPAVVDGSVYVGSDNGIRCTHRTPSPARFTGLPGLPGEKGGGRWVFPRQSHKMAEAKANRRGCSAHKLKAATGTKLIEAP